MGKENTMRKAIKIITTLTICGVMLAGCGNSKVETSESGSTNSMETVEKGDENDAEPEEDLNKESADETETVGANDSELFDNKIVVNQTELVMPTDVAAWENFGFTVPADKASYTLDPNTSTSISLKTADESSSMAVGIYNLGAEKLALGRCKLSSVTIKAKEFEGISVVFAKGITLGATQDQVKEAWGEPTKFVDGDASAPVLRERMVYKNDQDPVNNFYELSFEDKVLVSVELYVDEK